MRVWPDTEREKGRGPKGFLPLETANGPAGQMVWWARDDGRGRGLDAEGILPRFQTSRRLGQAHAKPVAGSERLSLGSMLLLGERFQRRDSDPVASL